MITKKFLIVFSLLIAIGCEKYDVVIRNGMVYDGNGLPPFLADVALSLIHI